MKLQGIRIKGRSVSGYSTSITLPEFGVSLDCGIANYDAVQCETVLITHAHLDHLGDVARHAYLRGMKGMAPTTFIVPGWLVPRIQELFTFWSKVQEARRAPYTVKASRWDGRIGIGKDRFVRSFKTHHRIRSQGYVLVEDRKGLKPGYQGLSGREYAKLRKEGVVFEETHEAPLVAFTGDTRASVYDDDLLALKAKVLIVECTFIGDDVTVAEAHKRGHTHISELAERADRFADVGTLLLTHFSQRYGNADIEAAIAKLPKELREKTHYLPVGR